MSSLSVRSSQLLLTCPWCVYDVVSAIPEDAKQHMRQHIYEEFNTHQVSRREVAPQQQEQLKKYLEALLH